MHLLQACPDLQGQDPRDGQGPGSRVSTGLHGCWAPLKFSSNCGRSLNVPYGDEGMKGRSLVRKECTVLWSQGCFVSQLEAVRVSSVKRPLPAHTELCAAELRSGFLGVSAGKESTCRDSRD